jgi:hydrogenase maturation protein HypF
VWDGTGYGADGTVWGGEFLLGTANTFSRVAHLRPFRLLGGDTAIREPRRVAASLLADTLGPEQADQIMKRLGWGGAERRFAGLCHKPQLGAVSTSAGRLFDAVASLVLGIDRAEYEGHPAMLLEAICDPAEDECYFLPIRRDRPAHLDWRPMIRSICDDLQRGVAPGSVAMRFHRGLAAAIKRVAERFSDRPVALCGGVFQNRVLVELVADELRNRGQPIGLPGAIPPNDGGLAAGQLAIALRHLVDHRQSLRK